MSFDERRGCIRVTSEMKEGDRVNIGDEFVFSSKVNMATFQTMVVIEIYREAKDWTPFSIQL